VASAGAGKSLWGGGEVPFDWDGVAAALVAFFAEAREERGLLKELERENTLAGGGSDALLPLLRPQHSSLPWRGGVVAHRVAAASSMHQQQQGILGPGDFAITTTATAASPAGAAGLNPTTLPGIPSRYNLPTRTISLIARSLEAPVHILQAMAKGPLWASTQFLTSLEQAVAAQEEAQAQEEREVVVGVGVGGVGGGGGGGGGDLPHNNNNTHTTPTFLLYWFSKLVSSYKRSLTGSTPRSGRTVDPSGSPHTNRTRTPHGEEQQGRNLHTELFSAFPPTPLKQVVSERLLPSDAALPSVAGGGGGGSGSGAAAGKSVVYSLGISLPDASSSSGSGSATRISCTSYPVSLDQLPTHLALPPLEIQNAVNAAITTLYSSTISPDPASLSRTAHVVKAAKSILFQAALASQGLSLPNNPSGIDAVGGRRPPLSDGFTAYTAGRACEQFHTLPRTFTALVSQLFILTRIPAKHLDPETLIELGEIMGVGDAGVIDALRVLPLARWAESVRYRVTAESKREGGGGGGYQESGTGTGGVAATTSADARVLALVRDSILQHHPSAANACRLSTPKNHEVGEPTTAAAAQENRGEGGGSVATTLLPRASGGSGSLTPSVFKGGENENSATPGSSRKAASAVTPPKSSSGKSSGAKRGAGWLGWLGLV